MAAVNLPPRLRPSTSVSAYMLASVGMTIANKQAVHALHAGTILLSLQMVATDCFVIVCHVLGIMRVEGSSSGVARWTPVGILFGVTIWAGMQALKYASLSTLTIVRNASPLFLLVAEWIAFGVRPTGSMVASLLVILVGVAIYTWDELSDASVNVVGILFIAMDAFLVCADGLLERYLLAHQPVELTLGATVLVSNVAGLVPVIVLLAGPCVTEWGELSPDPHGWLWAVVTLPGGVAMAYTSIILRVAVSATAALVVANVDKVILLCYGILFMGDTMDSYKIAGGSFALIGGAWHAMARLGAPSAQTLQSEQEATLISPTDAGIVLEENAS